MRHNDPVKPGNIVYWRHRYDPNFQSEPCVVVYVKTADWERSEAKGQRYARLSWAPKCFSWHPVDSLVVIKDTRSTNKEKQQEFLAEFHKEKEAQRKAELKAKYGPFD